MTPDEMVQDVLQEVPDAPLMTIRSMLSWAARDLCTRSDAWIETDTPVVIAANTEYPTVTASSGEPLRILSLLINGRRSAQGEGFKQLTPTTIAFDSTPHESIIYGDIACRPLPGDLPPQEVLDRWAEAITNGARWRLMLLPQPWRSPEMATYYQSIYGQSVNEAQQLSNFGHGKGGVRVKARPFL